MRTTITLDPDVDDAIRLGLTGAGESEGGEPFTFPTYRMGRAKVGLDKAVQLAAELEDEELPRQRALSR